MASIAAIALWGSAGIALLWTAYRSRSRWDEHAAEPFTALAGALGITSIGYAGTWFSEVTVFLVVPLLLFVVPVLWAVFVFQYTGRYALESRVQWAVLALPSAYLVCAHFGFAFAANRLTGMAPWEYEFTMANRVIEQVPETAQVLLHGLSAVQYVSNFFVMGLVLVATIVLVGQAVQYGHPSRRLALGLSAAAITPFVVQLAGSMVTMTAELPIEASHPPVSVAFVVSAIGFTAVVERHDLFAASPAAGTVGTKRVLKDLPEAVVVVDHEERIIRVNPAAGIEFGASADVVGSSIESLIGIDVAELRATASLDLDGSEGKHHYEPDVSEMLDRKGNVLGYTIVLRDVTDREMRQQRLEVLNRVLRHNLRNDMTTIRGRAEVLAAGNGDAMELGDAITDTADDLVQLGERAREIEQMLSITVRPDPACDLRRVVDRVVGDVTIHRAGDVTVDVPEDLAVGVDERIITPVVRNLVVNAVQHSDRERPSIDVTATVGQGQLPITLSVADDGPGLPENERVAIERGHEDPLEHGSGLGLWAVKWGVTRIGGQLSIADNEPRGTVIEIRLPRPTGTGPTSAGVQKGDSFAD